MHLKNTNGNLQDLHFTLSSSKHIFRFKLRCHLQLVKDAVCANNYQSPLVHKEYVFPTMTESISFLKSPVRKANTVCHWLQNTFNTCQLTYMISYYVAHLKKKLEEKCIILFIRVILSINAVNNHQRIPLKKLIDFITIFCRKSDSGKCKYTVLPYCCKYSLQVDVFRQEFYVDALMQLDSGLH